MSRNLNYLLSDDSDGDDLITARPPRPNRKPKPKHNPKKAESQIVSELSDEGDTPLSAATMTYRPGLFEEGWLMDSLKPFLDRGLITDVLERVRGGKEASVYVCAAHEALGVPYVAAKVYRPRMFRQIRDDAVYREGREVLSEEGRVVKKTDSRVMRAMEKKSAYGVQVSHTSWLMYEHNTLLALEAAGVDVPHVYGAGTNALLMSYIGGLHQAAPTLSQIDLELDEAQALFARALRNIERMLAAEVVHGDLSAYNILYWNGGITVIDFPQAGSPERNPNARALFDRDVARVCEYFADQGVDADAPALARRLWDTYVRHGAHKRMADNLLLMQEEEV